MAFQKQKLEAVLAFLSKLKYWTNDEPGFIAKNLKKGQLAQNVKNTVDLIFTNMFKDGWNIKKLFSARLLTNNFCHAEQILSVK